MSVFYFCLSSNNKIACLLRVLLNPDFRGGLQNEKQFFVTILRRTNWWQTVTRLLVHFKKVLTKSFQFYSQNGIGHIMNHLKMMIHLQCLIVIWLRFSWSEDQNIICAASRYEYENSRTVLWVSIVLVFYIIVWYSIISMVLYMM